MKVLFISSGNSKQGISILVKNQGETLEKQGVKVDYFTIKGKGLKGYLRHIPILRQYLKDNKYDIIHAHYSLTSYVAALAGARPLVVSLMGSDVQKNVPGRLILKLFHLFSRAEIIVKSQGMKEKLGLKRCRVIPNGVDMEKLSARNKTEAMKAVGFQPGKKHVLFLAHPARPEKNAALARQAVALLPREAVQLDIVHDAPYDRIPDYLYAADVVLLTSFWEGSPNVIKEAMACNCPIVSTGVGDVAEVTAQCDGCYTTSFDPADVAQKLNLALDFGKPTDGRERIGHLDSNRIAGEIIALYKKVLGI